ncbi:MAG: nitronate monooxygenase [Fimbriimonadaceae bacterium]|nr:nitronate monooxygenase [Fimbriimonadaceae bacterium]
MKLPKIPIWSAPTASIAGPELCTAITQAGGMGAMGLTWTEPETAGEWVRYVRERTQGPFFSNFALHFPPDALTAVLEAGCPYISFSWGDPLPHIQAVRDAGAGFGVQVVSVSGAQRALKIGADFIICQGIEAGGHVQSTSSLHELLPRVVEIAGDTPVIAAGGIGDAKAIHNVLELGATGAMLGTRFVATQESRAHDQYKQLLVDKSETALTVCFEDGWPYSASRVIRNSTLEEWESVGSPAIGERPHEGEITGTTASGYEIPRYSMVAPQQGATGNIEAMCLYAGTSIKAIHDLPKAGDLVGSLWREVEMLRSTQAH